MQALAFIGAAQRSGAKQIAAFICAAAMIFASNATQARGLIRDSEIENTLRKLTAPIFSAAGLPQETVPLFIVNEDSLNAFVAAGGRTMFLHTGLLRRLKTPEELMGVVAHEAGHITGGHIVRRIDAMRNARIQSIIATILGVGAGVATRDGGVGAGAVGLGDTVVRRALLKFSRGQEASADQAALSFMNRAGVDPSGLLSVLNELRREQAIFLTNVNRYALTHPLSAERMRLLQNGVSKSPARGKRASKDIQYWHGRMRAKLDGFLGRIGAQVESYGDKELDLYRKAIALHRVPEPAAAIATIDQLIRMRPKDPYYWELKGQILYESGRGPEAVAPYRKALRLAPSEALIAAGLGRSLLTVKSQKADKEALRVLERASLDDQYDASLRRPLAIAYARAGRQGMAAVVTAERLALIGRVAEAKSQAKRAQGMLPKGSPGWLRADDILALR